MWSLQEGHRTRGYFCGGVIQKGPFRILGSPLRGWGTNLMGPVVDDDVDPAALLAALDEVSREERVAMTELEFHGQRAEALQAAGYEAEEGRTYVVPLTPFDEKACWDRIHSKQYANCRRPGSPTTTRRAPHRRFLHPPSSPSSVLTPNQHQLSTVNEHHSSQAQNAGQHRCSEVRPIGTTGMGAAAR